MNDIASLCLSTIVPCVFLAGWVRCETVWALVLLVETSCVFQTVGTKLLHPHLSYPNEKPKTKLNPLKSKGDNL